MGVASRAAVKSGDARNAQWALAPLPIRSARYERKYLDAVRSVTVQEAGKRPGSTFYQ